MKPEELLKDVQKIIKPVLTRIEVLEKQSQETSKPKNITINASVKHQIKNEDFKKQEFFDELIALMVKYKVEKIENAKIKLIL